MRPNEQRLYTDSGSKDAAKRNAAYRNAAKRNDRSPNDTACTWVKSVVIPPNMIFILHDFYYVPMLGHSSVT